MKGRTSFAVLLTALAAILGFSVAGGLREERQLLDELAFTIQQQVHSSAQALATRLGALDQDTRMLADLIERSREHRDFDETTDRRVWESAFRALAVVVDPYRYIAFVTRGGRADVAAPNPTEKPSTIAALMPGAEAFGQEVAARGRPLLGKAFPYQNRWFFLYGAPVRGGGALVIASDQDIFLATVAGSALPATHLLVRDGTGVVWVGCETRGLCHPARDRVAVAAPRSSGRTMAETWEASLTHVGLRDPPGVERSEDVRRPTGAWSVTWMASSEAIVRHESALLGRVVLTAVAAALAVAGVGAIILRQQRRAVALEGQLRYAEAVANARNLETQLVRAEKLVTVGVLAAELAHEIGSPLAVIRGRAEQVLRAIPSPERREDVRIIIKHIDNISSTIRQLLDFSRRAPAEKVPVSLAEIIERTQGLMQWKLDAKGVALDADLEHGLPMLIADPDQLQQVLVNLLRNACDASQRGAVVNLKAGQAGQGMIVIEVLDHGAGISHEHVQAVFEPFFTTKKRGEGTGLGLPIAASIVRGHGGRIDLFSTLGQGTTVTLHWPAAAGEHSPLA